MAGYTESHAGRREFRRAVVVTVLFVRISVKLSIYHVGFSFLNFEAIGPLYFEPIF
jgi:hypothetical protein